MSLSLSACMTVHVSENNFIHPDSRSGVTINEKFDDAELQRALPGASLQKLTLDTTEAQVLQGVDVRQAAARATVLYFGGNMFHIDNSARHVVSALGQCKVNVVMFDYRGYGRSSGEPGVINMQSDALRIYDLVRAQTSGKLIVHGQSLGSFIAGHVAKNRPVDGLILESTATNAHDWAMATAPWFARPFINIELSPAVQGIDNAAAVSSYHGPALVLVGDKDNVTPQHLGRKVFEALPGASRRFVISPGGGHNGLLQRADIMDAYCGFIDTVKNTLP
ncbi:alpha/beta hydrolase [Undibacterium sp. TJN19]|uniref:alpha/beta hydrolase n=1 Tax=Undibacterium sp. TJN19 TaxID=3413055 RepID=UPI003BF1F7F8